MKGGNNVPMNYYGGNFSNQVRRNDFSNFNGNDRIIGGGAFLGPFILGGITGGLLAPAFYPRPYPRPYYNNYYPYGYGYYPYYR